MPARTRTIAALSIPSRIAIASAVFKTMPRMSRAKRYGVSDMTLIASAPQGLKMRTARAVPTPWLCRKTMMISRTTFCSAQALGAHRPDAGHLSQAIGLGLDDFEDRLAKCLDQFSGVDRADAADHAGGEILLD